MVQLVKNLPAMRESWVQSLGWEDPLEKGTANLSSILAWRIPVIFQRGEDRGCQWRQAALTACFLLLLSEAHYPHIAFNPHNHANHTV